MQTGTETGSEMRNFNVFLQVAVTGTVMAGLPVIEAQTRPAAGPPESLRSFSLGEQTGSFEYPAGWSPYHYANLHELWNASPERLANLKSGDRDSIARIETNVTPCADHAEAVHRLREIEAEWGMTSKFLTIGAWPALQRRQIIPRPRPSARGTVDTGPDRLVMVTTAVAAGATLIRLDGFAPENASPEVIDQMESIGLAVRPHAPGNPGQADKETDELRRSPSLRVPQQPDAPPLEAPETTHLQPRSVPDVTPGQAVNLGAFDNLVEGSESEIAVSTNGTYIVVAQQCSFRNSTDGGNSFTTTGKYPTTGGGNCTGGDSSVAFGKSGNFYWSTIGSNTATCPPGKNCNNTQEIARSTNNGVGFSNVTNVIDCQVTSGCGFGKVPDQEHIAADRFNASGSNQDQVYLVFRKGSGFGISCSTDSGSTWSAVTFYNNGSTDFPRVTVSQNGTVFVVTNNGNNIELYSFSSCQSGLTLGLNHQTIVTGINQVACPVSGLDRCNTGNILSSHTVTVDDTNANHLYAAYAVNTVAPSPIPPNTTPPILSTLGNENILVKDSTDGGTTWRGPITINQGVNGRRFQPWLCATGGTGFVAWYDRRSATTGTNDFTDYFGGSANLNGMGNLQVAATDFKIDTNGDPECASGWPCVPRNVNDSESCSTQPQAAGICCNLSNTNCPSNCQNCPGPSCTCGATSGQRCDFSGPDATTCPTSGDACQNDPSGGCPKYADYTASACLLGRFYTVWASATNQPNTTVNTTGISSFFVETVVTPTPTTTTYTGATTQDYHDVANLSATLVLGGTSIPVTGQSISFTLGTQSCGPVTTDMSGAASCTINLTQTPNAGGGGPYTVTASFTGAGNYQASSDSKTFIITKEETKVTYTGPTTQDYHDDVTVSATLTEDSSPVLASQMLTFTIGTQSCGPVATNVSGVASCTINLNQVPNAGGGGPYTVTATFAGSNFYLGSIDSKAFIITKEETTTKYTGPTVIANGVPTTFSAVLKEDGTVPIAGRTIKITLGTGGTAQSCNATPTDATGSASCVITPNQPLGAGTVAADFAGDNFYLPSHDSANTILFAFLTRGSFTLGNKTDSGTVEFWGDDWSTVNLLTGGSAPDAFKGFAGTTTEPPTCGSKWTTAPGNSSDPPSGPLPSFMGTVVSSAVGKSGPNISGTVLQIVVVTPNPGYDSNPGHHGTGAVVATYCK